MSASSSYWNPKVETMGLEEQRALQTTKLREQLRYVMERSSFYRRKFEEAGFDPVRLQTVDDLVYAPFTYKEELRESQVNHPPLGEHAVVDMEEVLRVHSSTGTTGRPSYVGLTRHDRDVWTEVVSRVYYCEGLRPWDILIHGFGLGFFVGGLPLKDAVENIGATFVPIGSGYSHRLVTSTQNLGGTVLTCTPSYAQYLAEFVRDRFGMEPSQLGLRRVMLGAEPGGGIPAVRQKISDDFGAFVTEGLGNADLIAVYAGSCDENDGMHFLAPDYLVLELIDPVTEEVLEWEDGAEGELVATHIDRECCPLVRFRTRDRIRVRMDPCACGRTGPRWTCIGRTDDMLIVRGVNVWPSAISDVVGSLRPRTTGAVQVLLYEPGPRVDPPLRLQVEYGPEATDLDALKVELEGLLREKLIVECEVELLPPGTLPRFEMKAQLVRKLYEESWFSG
ncbi:phenylacetate-CoA ligase [Rubrobacter xylanophilus DSM 9941]|uniref:Phenylacetate-CoA ligase n=1 Tax=Rubrobacter xylanophilus (strain DSM 9941 / JCM 11954 / NBRC 16129 / PRD-1) TaxID=266117 RepID=Q1AUX2_RUBXD|nr:phenylacetate--CoA ligase family protein [Rubrobacter xylanophilus]ABG04806.1 phenylacetate-CoA ligase [Rubrobacter xylanophilus DSM 9941]